MALTYGQDVGIEMLAAAIHQYPRNRVSYDIIS